MVFIKIDANRWRRLLSRVGSTWKSCTSAHWISGDSYHGPPVFHIILLYIRPVVTGGVKQCTATLYVPLRKMSVRDLPSSSESDVPNSTRHQTQHFLKRHDTTLVGWHTPGKSGGIFCKVFLISYQFSVLNFQNFGNLFLRAEQSDCIESFFVATSGFASIDWNASGVSSRSRKNNFRWFSKS